MVHEVFELRFGRPCKTTLWLSQKALDGIANFRRKGDPNGSFWKKIERYATNGFALYERGKPSPVLHEWDGVYRISDGTLFRLYGFYSDGRKSEFVVMDVALKKGTALSEPIRRQIDEIASIKRNGNWKKKVRDENYPRYTG